VVVAAKASPHLAPPLREPTPPRRVRWSSRGAARRSRAPARRACACRAPQLANLSFWALQRASGPAGQRASGPAGQRERCISMSSHGGDSTLR
jgi:hypothetical protein